MLEWISSYTIMITNAFATDRLRPMQDVTYKLFEKYFGVLWLSTRCLSITYNKIASFTGIAYVINTTYGST